MASASQDEFPFLRLITGHTVKLKTQESRDMLRLTNSPGQLAGSLIRQRIKRRKIIFIFFEILKEEDLDENPARKKEKKKDPRGARAEEKQSSHFKSIKKT